MKTQNALCPSDSALSDFGLGKLDAASAETVSQHLETCDGCRQRVASLPGDSFVDRLREAGDNSKPGRTPPKAQRTFVPGESIAGVSTSDTSQSGIPRTRPAVANEKAPPELANHPDYELMWQLGQGGMGTVYLVRHRITHRYEVLKVVSKSLLDHAGAMERFQNEIRSACSLAHPNIVAAYGVLHLGDMLIFVMEYVNGEDMSQLVKRKGPLPIANAAFYGHQAALGLQHAHEKGMVHRDIKPNNLMLAVEGKKHIVKILDFGLAKSTSEKAANIGLTKSDQMLGTPDYVAPEQTLKANKADIRSDIYSLGCTLYFLLSGGPPFQEVSLYEILQAHHTRDARPLNLVRPEVPVELATVVGKMMAKDPAKRYQTPVEVARALLPFCKPGQTVVRADSPRGAPSDQHRLPQPAMPSTAPPVVRAVPSQLPISAPPASETCSDDAQAPRAIQQPPRTIFNHNVLLWAGAGALIFVALVVAYLRTRLPPMTPEHKREAIVRDSTSNPIPVRTQPPIAPLKPKPKLVVMLNNSISMDLVLLQPGKFKMGSPDDDGDAAGDEKPQVEVVLTQALYVGKTEVTQGQWQAVMNTTPWRGQKYVKEGAEYAASCVTWDDAQDFCKQLGVKDGETYRLLSEAEWEYACRGGTTTKYHFGDDKTALGSYAWYDENAWNFGKGHAHEVAKKQPNRLGLYDMHGNVREWCGDLYAGKLESGDDPYGNTGVWDRVHRGGGWNLGAASCRSAARGRSEQKSHRCYDLGFRVARVPFSQAKGG